MSRVRPFSWPSNIPRCGRTTSSSSGRPLMGTQAASRSCLLICGIRRTEVLWGVCVCAPHTTKCSRLTAPAPAPPGDVPAALRALFPSRGRSRRPAAGCVRRLGLGVRLRSSRAASGACVGASFSSALEQHSLVWMDHISFIHSLSDGHLGRFHVSLV